MIESPTPNQIKEARMRAQLTQAQAAAVLGYSRRTWIAWETGQTLMRAPLYEQFALHAAALQQVFEQLKADT